ncbi:hypothetical protein EVAR_25804_1 [Eumeta japonica]|uniref:Uncharacterized protein n=1 Tax=Eumeta variegata TaxID=151549 RepID=A0A4C1VVE2_EUMVA|nr:hypothetical protein EVAR_25804_1 [Eumeta japonica]
MCFEYLRACGARSVTPGQIPAAVITARPLIGVLGASGAIATKKGKRARRRGRKMLQQQQQRQQQPTEPRATGHPREERVRRVDQLRSRPPSLTMQPRQQLPPLPQQRRPIGRPLPTPTISDLAQEVASLKAAMSEMTKILITILNQDWPGSDTGHSGRPDTRGDVLNLRIIYWNPGGIIGKTHELRDLAQLEGAHIILLGETKLRPEQELKIPNFFAYQRDEISARGPAYRDTAVLIRRDIMHEAEQLMDFETMRSIGIRVGSSEQEIRLFAAYRPPGTKMCVQDIHAII